MEMSAEVNELFAAMAKAQAVVRDAAKDGKSNRNKYATLESVLVSVREAFGPHGLAVVQMPQDVEGGVVVETMVVHSSGQWMRSSIAVGVKADKGMSTVQTMGSAITYLRRYTLMALAGIAPEDDDGATAGSAEVKRRKAPEPLPPTKWTEAQQKGFFAQVNTELARCGVGYDELAAWCEANGRPRPSLMPVEQRRKLVEAITGPAEVAMTVAEWAAKQASDAGEVAA